MKRYLYILNGTDSFKDLLEEKGIRIGFGDLLMIEEGSEEELSIIDNLKEILNYRLKELKEKKE
jgi:hypothetical protein